MKLDPRYIKHTPLTRIYGLDIPTVAITGGVATGKSTVSNILIDQGLYLFDADRLIHRIYIQTDTFNFISLTFPEAVWEHQISFPILRKIIFSDDKAKESLEGFLYPKLEKEFCEEVKKRNPDLIIYDVPLLFEKKINEKVDVSVCVYAPRKTQLQRLMLRDNIDCAQAEAMLNSQMDIDQKAKLSDFVVRNEGDISELREQVSNLLKLLKE